MDWWPAEQQLPVSFLLRTLMACSLLAACTSNAAEAPVGLDGAVVLPTPAVASWRVEQGLRTVGSVVRFEESIGPGRHLFSVRNVHDQDLGYVDSVGRAWRLRPHAEPELLGSGTVAQGAARILGLSEVELVELAGGAR